MDVGEELPVRDVGLAVAADLGEHPHAVERHLLDRGPQVQRAVPGSARRGRRVEARTLSGIGERGVDDLRVGDAEDHVHPGEAGRMPLLLRLQPSVGGPCEPDQVLESGFVFGEVRQGVLGLRGVLPRDQAGGVVESDGGDPRPGHNPPRLPSSSARTASMAGIPPRIIVSTGVWPLKTGLLLGSSTHSSASSPGCRTCSAV